MKESGVGPAIATPRGGGAIGPMTEGFEPNLAMGGGSFRYHLELPSGPGGYSPKLDLIYHTGYGNGPLGMGWMLSVPFVARRVGGRFGAGKERFLLSGADPLVATETGDFVPRTGTEAQRFAFQDGHWTSRGLNLVEMRFGATSNSRVESVVGGERRVLRWLLDRVVFPGGRTVEFRYAEHGAQRYLSEATWSIFRVRVLTETRPDPLSAAAHGVMVETTERISRIVLEQPGRSPELLRSWSFDYADPGATPRSLLSRIRLTGFSRTRDGQDLAMEAPPVSFDYTVLAPQDQRIERASGLGDPPPPLGEDVTLFDYHGTGLPGILRLTREGGRFWENRGGGLFGPGERLGDLPQNLSLADPGVALADLTRSATADLVVTDRDDGPGVYPHRPGSGFGRKVAARVQPDFSITADGNRLMDLDGDGASDLISFRGRQPLVWFNDEDGQRWDGPYTVPISEMPDFAPGGLPPRLADMNGDGKADLVALSSGRLVWYPNLGGARFGPARRMEGVPEFSVPDQNEDVALVDIDGDGAADLVLFGTEDIRIWLNTGGRAFHGPIVLPRTPKIAARRAILADVTGSGTPGFLWSSKDPASRGYYYLDPLAGQKPYLLSRIDNGSGLVTEIVYSTSTQEHARDLARGERWTGSLPFGVQVVKSMTRRCVVTGEVQTETYDYHDGHYDGRAREFMGFAAVDRRMEATAHEDAVLQRHAYHTRDATRRDLGFVAGKGQPRRIEVVDAATGLVRSIEESEYEALPVGGALDDAWIVAQKSHRKHRFEGPTVYASEIHTYQYDAVGNRVLEDRRSQWTDPDGTAREDRLVIETSYAAHPTHGTTNLISRRRKHDGAGRLMKEMRCFYDGPAFTGLSAGQVETGFQTRQEEVALTSHEIAAAYDGTPPTELATLYQQETDPVFGQLWLRDTRAYTLDALGNQTVTRDARGHEVRLTYDPDGLFPVSYQEDGGPPRAMDHDALTLQVTMIEDLNGNRVHSEFDGLGNIIRIWRRDAAPNRPTEIYERDFQTVPNRTDVRIRLGHDETTPGVHKVQYRDGSGRIVQERALDETGGWSVQKGSVHSHRAQEVRVTAAYRSPTDAFEPVPPTGSPILRRFFDFAGRPRKEEGFAGGLSLYRYNANRAEFFGPDRAPGLAGNPALAPTRASLTDARDNIILIEESAVNGPSVQRRDYDALGRIVRITDPTGAEALSSVHDLWGKRIAVTSAEAGRTRFVRDALGDTLRETNAAGDTLEYVRDAKGRVTEVRENGATVETHVHDTGPGTNVTGRLAEVTSPAGTVRFSYTAEGDVARIERTVPGETGTFVTEFTYDAQRKIRSVVTPDAARTEYDYHATGPLRSVSGAIDDIEYTPSGKRDRVRFANGLETRRHWREGDGLLLSIVTEPTAGGQSLQDLAYTLDPLGQVTRIEDRASVAGKVRNDQTFAYDGQNRLVLATGRGPNGPYSFAYAHDEAANLTRSEEFSPADLVYGEGAPRNALRRRSDATGPEWTYDAAGRMTRDPELGDLFWDARNRLTQVVAPDGTHIRYTYDHDDNLVLTEVEKGGTTRRQIVIEGLWIRDDAGATRVISDEGRRLAAITAAGGLLYHFDRIGNVNIVSDLATGGFVGQNEYTPFGQLTISISNGALHYFQGRRFSDGTDLVLLGVRHYRARIGRFLAPDRYLLLAQEDIVAMQAATNLYIYALANPANFTDPTGRLAFLAILGIAALVGLALGAIAAGVNGVTDPGEFFLWMLGGAIGAVLAVLVGTGIAVLAGAGAAIAATVSLIVYAGVNLLGTVLTRVLDATESEVAWGFSFFFKFLQSPITTTVGLIAAIVVAARGGNVDFRRGMLFIEVGPGNSALTLGAVAWTQSGRFEADGTVADWLARHESVHSRQVVAMGELGFYFTYVTVGAIWGAAEGGCWNDINAAGEGNPLEKRAHEENAATAGIACA